ncbi:hypothetical protein BH10BAC4_BH10BAC4_26200 [soil metagenome]
MNKLDELFNEKLKTHSITPSAGAWEKIEAGLSKKNKPVIWWRWAAVFLLGALLAGILLIRREETVVPLTESKQIPETDIESTKKVTQKPVAQVTEEKKVGKDPLRQKKRKADPAQKPLDHNEIIKEEKEAVAQMTIPLVNDLVVAKEEIVGQVLPASKSMKSQSIVLTYTLDTIEPTPSAQIETANVEKEANSFKKVMKFANDVKNGDSPLAGIRVMKEDLFALDLKKKNTSKKQ